MQHYVIEFVSDLRHIGGFHQVLRFSPTNKTDHHDITEIVLKVALNTTTLAKPYIISMFQNDISDHISEYRMNYQAVLNDDDSYYNYYYEDTDDIAHNITLSNNYITRQLYLTSMQSLIW